MALAFTKLPFTEASDFLRQKVRLPTQSWRDIQRGMHSQAFVIAGAMKTELLEDMQSAVLKGIEQGTTLQQFKKDFNGIVKKHGWTFKQDPGWRAGVIYNTNMRTAFAAGAEAQMQRTKSRRPYARYIAGLSAEPRAEHLTWHGTILPLDHPWWSTHTPPNDWGCKCKKVSVSQRELDRDGLEVLKNAPDNGSRQVTDPITGKKQSLENGLGLSWDYNPGQAAWGQQFAKQLADKLVSGKLVDMDSRGPGDFNRPASVSVDSAKATPVSRTKSENELRQVLRDSIGGEEKTFIDPLGEFVNVNQGIVDHILEKPQSRFDGREQFFPLIPEVIEDPFEVWVGFARSEKTGQVFLRKRYIKFIQLDKKRTFGLIAEVRNGMWVGFDFFRGRPTAAKNLRKGLLVWGR